jgi:DNA polymerase-3 subunit gamma/tau
VISARLRQILAIEKIEADDAAIALVAREAAGSMRDALTVLDQVLALGGDRLEGDAVAQGLGVAGRKHVWATLRAVLQGDAASVLHGVHEVAEQGLDVLNYTRQLLECARDLVVFKVVNASEELLELSPEEREAASSLAGAHPQQDLERLFSGLSALMEEVGLAGMPKLALEMGLVRLSDRPPIVPLGELLDRLSGLESRLGPAASGGGGRSGPQRSGPVTGGSRDSSGPGGVRDAVGAGFAGAAAPVMTAERAAAPVASAAPIIAAPIPTSVAPTIAASAASKAARPEPAPQPLAAAVDLRSDAAALAAPAVAPRVEMPLQPRAAAPVPAPTADLPADPSVSAAPQPLAADSAPAKPAPPEPEGILGGDWMRIVTLLKNSQPALAAVLDHGTPIEVSARLLKIGFSEGSFFGRQAQSTNARDGILRAAEQVLGARPELQFGRADDAAADGTLAAAAASNRKARQAGRREAALSHPRVQEAMEVFEESEQSVDIQVDME